MKDIVELRNKIDSIDEKIKDLLISRLKIVDEIKGYKLRNGIEIEDKKREKEIIDLVTKDLDVETKDIITDIFMKIINASREYQKK